MNENVVKFPVRIRKENVIGSYLHCKKCIEELPDGQSPQSWASLEVGWTEVGLQVWCKRHGENVIHIDFEGEQHPAV